MKTGIYYIIVTAVVSMIGLLAIIASVNESVVQIPLAFKADIHELLPQGWSFFTRSPREEMADIYSVDPRYHIERVSSPCSAPSNFFGISRKSRKVGMELSIIASKITDSLWIRKDIPQVSVKDLPVNKIKLDPGMTDRLVPNGEYIIRAETPIPWAWSKSTHTNAKVRIIRIQLS